MNFRKYVKSQQKICKTCKYSKEKPNHLERTLPALASVSTDSTALPLQEDVARAQAAVASANHGLLTYQLKPEGMKGGELFAHMIQFRENHNWNKGKEFDSSGVMVSPRKYLDVEVKPDNQKVLKAATEAIVGGNITAKRNILSRSRGPRAPSQQKVGWPGLRERLPNVRRTYLPMY